MLVGIQVAICAWSLMLRDALPTSVISMIDESFDNYLLDGTLKYDHINKWNRLQSEVHKSSPAFIVINISPIFNYFSVTDEMLWNSWAHRLYDAR